MKIETTANMNVDVRWMQYAIELAHRAWQKNEVPVGAVLVANEMVLGEGYNQPIISCDPTAHAEIIALREAGKHQQNYRLLHSTLYVTLEPCMMCVGAMVHARIKRLVYGAHDPKTGAVCGVFDLLEPHRLNHRIVYQGGILAEECGKLLRDFFQAKRKI